MIAVVSLVEVVVVTESTSVFVIVTTTILVSVTVVEVVTDTVGKTVLRPVRSCTCGQNRLTDVVDRVTVLVTTVEKYEEQSAFAMAGRDVPAFERVPRRARRQLSALQAALRSIYNTEASR